MELSHFDDIVIDPLTRLLQEGVGEGGIHLFGAGGGDRRPEVAGKDDTSAAQKGGGKWADEVRWKAA